MFKKIGVLICAATESYQTALLQGIISKAYDLKYDVLVFATFVKECFQEKYELGERNIFNLVNYNKLDGLIVAGDTLKMRGLNELLFPRLQNECKCPMVFVDYNNNLGFDNITTNDTPAFEEIIDHLIDVHGCRNILFYSGPYEVSSTQTRFKGYKNSLKKHGMELNPDFYSFEGDFWIESGKRVAREIIEGKRPRPDAIAFCGDHMAIAAQKVFQAAGWNIPDDIIITGYDAIDESLRCIPPITSCTPPVSATGTNAVIALDAKIQGISNVSHLSIGGKLEIGGSCGCEEDFNYTKRIYYRSETSQTYDDFLHSSMMEDMAEADTFFSLLNKIGFYLYLVPGWKLFNLCLCDNWLNSSTYVEDNEYITEGYTDKMVLFMDCWDGTGRILQDTFDTSIMLPELYKERSEPTTFYFLPIHFNDKCFGYSMLSYGSEVKVFDINYMNWTKHICSALEYYRVQSKVSNIALFDVLTGAYTRIGINKNINSLTAYIDNENFRFCILVADLDNLKTINDTLGHQSGDIAIHELAKILLSVTGDFELCARTGGDEFVIMGCGEYPDSHIQDTIDRINAKLDAINATGRLNFKLSASLGGVVRKISSTQDIDELYQEADKKMYEMKKTHHAIR